MELYTIVPYETVTLTKGSSLQRTSEEEEEYYYTEVHEVRNPCAAKEESTLTSDGSKNTMLPLPGDTKRKPTPQEHVEVLRKLDATASELFESSYEELK